MKVAMHILLVDDEPDFSRGLSRLISVEYPEIQISTASSGEEALATVAGNQVDLVITDLRMPGMDGPEAIARLRADQPDLQIVALTSFADEPLVRRAVDAGATGYLLKTADESEIVAAIRLAYEGRTVLGLRLTWDKRYITLAPVATVLGLAFRAYDPDGLLGGEEDLEKSDKYNNRYCRPDTSECVSERDFCDSHTDNDSE